MEIRNDSKKRIIIYVAIAYGITFLLAFLMWYGSGKGYDLSVFPTAQMLYPAAGVILGLLVTNKGRQKLPKGYFITCLGIGVLPVGERPEFCRYRPLYSN